ncbi:MAG TPA: glycoside hydrolase family 125 protein, partial [Candidatus Limnocylindria bacterium]|nr:glycoside hydrolase family 125 protein [Candidatus Limnocylindria bacterium]
AEAEMLALARDARPLLEDRLSRPRRVVPAVAWLADCVASDVGDGAVALLADHAILPLVWTRDAYFVARALLAAGRRDLVDAFLRWCFERAARLDGRWWPRSSLATGEPKDRAFQLDQQLYPLLLLAETGGPAAERYRRAAEEQLDAVLARADGGLVATSETPADDRLEQPFHFSSHVLLWKTVRALGRDAEPLRRLVRDRFTHGGRFAYAIGAGVRHYHDANDLPTALAPAWGFCDADDDVWRATIAYAWSRENAAHFDGPLGGLGSLHTPHPWPLGDLQRVVVARARRDEDAERDAWSRLGRVATWDGLLPEAYDEGDGSVASRHWFAWPVALRATLRR